MNGGGLEMMLYSLFSARSQEEADGALKWGIRKTIIRTVPSCGQDLTPAPRTEWERSK
jgi:hypothetical protein